ncbi:hypothetical protein AAFF_G00120610 [Aldrovandia affinis]|uniref:Uncharacterized protein n=1 Tax=Aldrovandia affinis TaxID=143900 RepID=A0AAD7WAC4_9TELE|nr:hypothetical protein AAFF_G00120610 [Aldrovandia affinis]
MGPKKIMASWKGDDHKSWCLRRVKVAVAVAVIKSKPPGRSGREQAEYLAAKLRSHGEDWEAKARALQVEVLHLRQELLLSKVLSKTGCAGAAAGDASIIDPLSLDPVSSARDTPSWDQDSGCGTRESTEAALLPPTPPDPHGEREPPTPAPRPGRGPFSSTRSSSRTWWAWRAWRAARTSRRSGCCVPRTGTAAAVVSDSVCQLLSGLAAARVAALAVDRWTSGRTPSADLMTRVGERLKELTDLLLNNSWLNRFDVQETLADCLILLGGSSLLKPLLIGHILCQVNRFADQLWETCQANDDRSFGSRVRSTFAVTASRDERWHLTYQRRRYDSTYSRRRQTF